MPGWWLSAKQGRSGHANAFQVSLRDVPAVRVAQLWRETAMAADQVSVGAQGGTTLLFLQVLFSRDPKSAAGRPLSCSDRTCTGAASMWN